MKTKKAILTAVLAVSTLLYACDVASGDLLSEIRARGYVLVSTNSDYAPQSYRNPDGKRPRGTKCPPEALTTAEMQGFDIDVAVEIGKRLGVESCFVTPEWNRVVVGGWGDKWDINVGSMSITRARQAVLSFTSAYYYLPAAVAVTKESGITSLEQLSGKWLCAASLSEYEGWLRGSLDLPTEDIFAKPPSSITPAPPPSGENCAQALKGGNKDLVGYVDSEAAIDANIAAGVPVVEVGGPVYADSIAVAIDKAHSKNISSLVSALDGFIKSMHEDGTLSALSNKWFQVDLTRAPVP